MNSITQNYKELLKNNLKNKINFISEELINTVLKSLNSNTKNNEYANLVFKVEEKTKKLIIEVLIETFEYIDKSFSVSAERKAKYYINKSNVSRTIITLFGELTFKRTYYSSKLNNDKIFYLDKVLNLPKYNHYDPIVKATAIDKSFSTNQAQAGRDTGELIGTISDKCDNREITYIPRQTVNNWIRDWKVPRMNYKETYTPKILYVMGDEKFIGCQNLDNDIMVKCMIAFEDIKHVSKNRNELTNKTIYSMYGQKPWEQFTNILTQKYNFDEIDTIYFIGDGGNWIKIGPSELKMNPKTTIIRLLCEFHFKQAINRITTKSELRKEFEEIFRNKTKLEFKKRILEFKDEIKEESRKEGIEKNLNYILNNYKAIKDMLDSKVGSSMESHISHYVASLFASRPKGYSSETITQYLDIYNLKLNGFNIYDLYLKTYNNEEIITLGEDDINYSIFEKKNSSLPIISNGERTGAYESLYSIIY